MKETLSKLDPTEHFIVLEDQNPEIVERWVIQNGVQRISEAPKLQNVRSGCQGSVP